MKNSNSGFSLVELLIAIAIILIAVSAIVPLYVHIAQASESNRMRTIASNLANEVLEDIRSVEFYEVGVVGGHPEGPFLQSEIRMIDGKNYKVQIFINWLEEGSYCLGSDGELVPGQGSWDYKGVKVEVTATSVFTGEDIVSATTDTIIARDASQPAQPGANVRTCIFRGWRPDVDVYEPVFSVKVNLTLESGETASVWSTTKGSTLFVDRPVGNHTVTVDPSSLGMIVAPGTTPIAVSATAANTITNLVLVEYPCSINVQLVDDEGEAILGSGKLIIETPFTDADEQAINIIHEFSKGSEPFLVTGIWPVGTGFSGVYNLKIQDIDGFEDYDMSNADIKPLLNNGDDWNGKFSAPNTEIDLTIELKKEILPLMGNLVLHLDADAIDGLEDGNIISQWDDLSGKGNHAVRVGSDPTPTYRVIEGEPLVSFNGSVKEYLETSLHTDNNHFFADSSTDWSIAVVFRVSEDPENGIIDGIIAGAAGGIGGSTTFAIYMHNGNVCVRLRGDTDFSAQIVGEDIEADTWHQIVVTWDGEDAIGYFNGGEGVELPVDDAGRQNQRFYLGSSRRNLSNYNYFTGDIAEIIVYDTDLSSEDRESVEKYLGEKWLGWIPD